jgi:hypothetical protein
MASNKKINLENFKKEIKEDSRPWGKFRSFPYKQAKNIKIITVNPGETLSLQYHHHRSEFWCPQEKPSSSSLPWAKESSRDGDLDRRL